MTLEMCLLYRDATSTVPSQMVPFLPGILHNKMTASATLDAMDLDVKSLDNNISVKGFQAHGEGRQGCTITHLHCQCIMSTEPAQV